MTTRTESRVLGVARRFLRYSFREINFDYDELTDEERRLCTRTEFDELVRFAKGQDDDETSSS